MKTVALLFFLLAAAGYGQTLTQYPPSAGGSGTITGVTAGTGLSGGGTSGTVTITGTVPCVGTPGNTTANYRQFCQAASGAVYACNNSAGCSVAADWVSVGVTGPNSSTNGDLVCWNGVTGAVLSDCGILGTNVVTLAGTQTLTNKTLTSPTYTLNAASSSATPAFNLALGTLQTNTLTANVTSFTFTNAYAGGRWCLDFIQGGSGGYTVTGAPTSVHGFFTIPSSEAVGKHNVGCFYSSDGTNLYNENGLNQ